LDYQSLENAISADTILVSLMAANNEIGTTNDLETIGAICSKKKVLFHTDASQAVGKISVDVEKMNIDLLSFSGHKFYAPKERVGL
jgi:cysteine desulfurase